MKHFFDNVLYAPKSHEKQLTEFMPLCSKPLLPSWNVGLPPGMFMGDEGISLEPTLSSDPG